MHNAKPVISSHTPASNHDCKIKILVDFQAGHSPTSPWEIEVIEKERLTFKRPVKGDFIRQIRGLYLYLKIWGQWREYRISEFSSAELGGDVKVVQYKVKDEERNSFYRDFSLARN
ncbi:MAG: hypothetical protein WCG27_05080 [Pseudomonadota bacterium]